MKAKFCLFLSFAILTLPALGQDPTVHIVGTQTDTEARRDFIAGTIIIGRKRIEDSAVRSVGELLKREPAVTVRDGSISLLNLPGYTQILLDGQATPAGRSAADLDLIHVEQIEIIKSSAAQYGPFGIAGTINIISRKSARTSNTHLQGGVQAGDRNAVDLAVSHGQAVPGSPLQYNFQLSARRDDTRRDSHLRQTASQNGAGELHQWSAHAIDDSAMPMLSLTANATWKSGTAGTVVLSPEISTMEERTVRTESRQWGNATTLMSQDSGNATSRSLSLPFRWTFKPTRKRQLELIARVYRARMNIEDKRIDTASATEIDVRFGTERLETQSKKLEFVYTAALNGGHAIKAGTSLLRTRTDENYEHHINGSPDIALNALGMSRLSRTEQKRLFLQDEWRINEHFASKIGMSGAQNANAINETTGRVGTHFRMWSPSLHLSAKLGGDDKRQIRLGLARSFKAPADQQLLQRPEINPLAPCSSSGVCLANTIDTADTSGNLQLRPERARALNLSYEHGIGDESQITVEIFTRRIEGKHGNQILFENVPWSAARRYVARPVNLGTARANGINVEMELALHDLKKTAPKATLRGSVGFARSRIASLPGPDNHLDKQTPWTAKLGGSYGMKTAPVKFDLDANWGPGQWTRTSLSERAYAPRNVECDASMSWSINKDSRLVIDAGTRYPRIHQPINEYFAGEQLVRLYTAEKRSTRIKLQFEKKL